LAPLALSGQAHPTGPESRSLNRRCVNTLSVRTCALQLCPKDGRGPEPPEAACALLAGPRLAPSSRRSCGLHRRLLPPQAGSTSLQIASDRPNGPVTPASSTHDGDEETFDAPRALPSPLVRLLFRLRFTMSARECYRAPEGGSDERSLETGW